jgi:hypothetical protein
VPLSLIRRLDSRVRLLVVKVMEEVRNRLRGLFYGGVGSEGWLCVRNVNRTLVQESTESRIPREPIAEKFEAEKANNDPLGSQGRRHYNNVDVTRCWYQKKGNNVQSGAPKA